MSDKSNKKALKSGVWYTVANFVAKGIGFLTAPVFNRLLSTTEVGDYSNFASWGYVFSSLLTLDLFTSVVLAKFDYKEKLEEYVTSILVLGSVWTCAVYVFALFFQQQLQNLLSLSDLQFHLLFVMAVFSPALNIIQMKNRMEYKYRLSVFITLLSTVLSTIISLVCVLTFQNRLTGRILGLNVPIGVINIALYVYLFKRAPRVRTGYWKHALKISVPLIFSVMGGHLLTVGDRILITRICGKPDNALYSVAYSAAFAISILMTSIYSAWSPWALEQMNEQNYPALKKAAKPYIALLGLVSLCFLLVTPELLWIMGGEGYMHALLVIPPVVLGIVFQSVYSLYQDVETFCRKQKTIAVGTILAAFINLVLNYLLLPIYGYVAAAYTTLLSYLFLFTFHFLAVFRMKKQQWFSTRFNLLYLLAMSGATFAITLTFKSNLVRYSLVGISFLIGLIVVVMLRRELIYLVREKSTVRLKKRVNEIRLKICRTKGEP